MTSPTLERSPRILVIEDDAIEYPTATGRHARRSELAEMVATYWLDLNVGVPFEDA